MSELTKASLFYGLVDHGLFCEKVPACFTSIGLTSEIGGLATDWLAVNNERDLKTVLDKATHDYIRYEALRDVNTPRHIGIPHPESYICQAMAIRNHWPAINEHCNKPTPRASRIFVQPVGDGRVFSMNYKGPERYDNEEAELKWMAGAMFVAKADISTCFPSIYTHSIPWAIVGREAAKRNRNAMGSIGNLLDKTTQTLRDGQTNGLLIGPHSSNILSEIILTKIDTELNKRGHTTFIRHIDDYEYYSQDYGGAERFLQDLGLQLRHFELSLNEKKTQILALPRPSSANWVRELNRFSFPKGKPIAFSTIRSFLDLAMELAIEAKTSATLNYAIKMIPSNLDERAMRLYTREVTNLALIYPYLASYLDRHVFGKFPHEGQLGTVADFASGLVNLGLKKLYPDAIAHGLYYAIKHVTSLKISIRDLHSILALDDCLVTNLLLEYAEHESLQDVIKAIAIRSQLLKKDDKRNQDKQWLLAYQTWTESDLIGNSQPFLANLKNRGFSFIRFHPSI